MDAAARHYFDVWNMHSAEGVAALFAAEGTLRDWDVSVSGAAAVGAANGSIFAAVPNIKISVEDVFVDEAKRTAVAEILVALNDADGTVLKVVDVIQFDESGLIKALRAYKG